jgi:N4-gp56 family major capsid protein
MSISWTELSGGIYVNPELSSQARHVAAYSTRLYDLVTPADDFFLGRKHGDTIGFKLFGRIAGTSETGLGEFQKIPMATMPQYEVTATVARRGIAVPWTGLREDLDRLSVEDAVIHGLKEHSQRTHEKVIYDALVAGRSFTYVALTASTQQVRTDGTVISSANANFSAYHARRVKLTLTQYNTPFADGSNYLAVVSPTMWMNFFDDVGVNGYVDVKKYAGGGADGVMNGEVGSYQGIRFIEDNTTTILPDAIGTGTAYGSGFFVGADAVREIPVYPMQLLANTNLSGDFGQQKAIAWLSLMAYKTVWNYTTHGQGVVLHYTST